MDSLKNYRKRLHYLCKSGRNRIIWILISLCHMDPPILKESKMINNGSGGRSTLFAQKVPKQKKKSAMRDSLFPLMAEAFP